MKDYAPNQQLLLAAVLDNLRAASANATAAYNKAQSLDIVANPDVQERLPFEMDEASLFKWEVAMLEEVTADLSSSVLAINQAKNAVKQLMKSRNK